MTPRLSPTVSYWYCRMYWHCRKFNSKKNLPSKMFFAAPYCRVIFIYRSSYLFKQEAHQLVVRQNATPLEFDPKPSKAAFSNVFFAVAPDRKWLVTSFRCKCRAGRLGCAVKFGDSSPNGSRDIQQRSRRMLHFRLFFKTSITANRK